MSLSSTRTVPTAAALVLVALATLSACATTAPSPGPTAAQPAGATPEKPTTSAAIASPSDDAWHCEGNLVPPSGWEQETAFRDIAQPNAREGAWDDAAAKLSARLCEHGSGCDFLRAHVRNWKTGSNGRDICAMAVIAKEDLDVWRGGGEDLDRALDAAARALVTHETPRVAVDHLRDKGVAGGVRAEWLRERLAAHLAKIATVLPVPPGWAGDKSPAGIDLVVSGDIFERTERQIPIVEVTWTGTLHSGQRRSSDAMTFPVAMAPPFVGPVVTAPVVDSGDLAVRVDSSRAGSLCEGETAQLWVHADHAATLRVFDLYGDGDAMLIYPNPEQPAGIIGANKTIPLAGNRGFEAVPVEGYEAERFLVVAGAPGTLGKMDPLKGPCRLPGAVARDLSQGGSIPTGARQASTGYRILTGPGTSCPPADPRRREAAARALAAIPECTW